MSSTIHPVGVRQSPSAMPSKWGQRSLYPLLAIIFLGVASSFIVVGGVSLSETFAPTKVSDLLSVMCRWDGEFYQAIATVGYNYDASRGSRVAFFPAYPLTARALSRVLGTCVPLTLVMLSSLCLIAALLLMHAYLSVDVRPARPDDELNDVRTSSWRTYAILSMALMPATFFFRMAYSESMFLLASILALYTMRRQFPFIVVALAAGLATAVRPVGVALLLPLAWNLHRQSATLGQAAKRFFLLLPFSCWGLLGYIVFQYWRFGQPFAFALTQENWHLRPPAPTGEKLFSLLAWEPIWSVYIPRAYGYWRDFPPQVSALLSLQFANPIYLVGTAVLVVFGAWRRWLTAEELMMSAALLAIPYFTRGYEMCMASQGRFAVVVFPAYIVIGRLLAALPAVVATSILAFSAFLMALYAAMFAVGYPLI